MTTSEKQTSEILWPHQSIVEVGSDVDFIYIMRKDGECTMNPIAQAVATEYHLPIGPVRSIFREHYETFFEQLSDHLTYAFAPKGHVELHIFDPDVLDEQERKKAGFLPIVSLDPLMDKGVHSLKVSRGFWLGGIHDHRQVNRPGSNSLNLQANKIKESVGDVPVCVVEDDIFSGGSVIRALSSLREAGVTIKKLVVGIQVGTPTKLDQMGIVVDPVVVYKSTDGSNIFDKVDLGDPRDYLLGASGLVERLPDGSYGRAPYILPFVSTSARASISRELEVEFATRVLMSTVEFFFRVEEQLGKPVLVNQMDPHFGQLLYKVFGIESNIPMKQLSVWFLDNLDQMWKTNKTLGDLHKDIDELGLPKNVVFLDVDGTIIADDATTATIDSSSLDAFQQVVQKLIAQGISVGLNSDSPLPQLIDFAEKIGIPNAPIIAENGSLIAYQGKKLLLNMLSDHVGIMKAIHAYTESIGYQRTSDCIHPTFSGKPLQYDMGEWAFGANREASISVFGPPDLIRKFGKKFTDFNGASVDCSPEYNFFAVHPNDYMKNKGRALSMLSQFGHNVVMVGNSVSDWVDSDSGVKCTFVAGSRISDEIMTSSAMVAKKPLMEGVVEILSQISLGGSV